MQSIKIALLIGSTSLTCVVGTIFILAGIHIVITITCFVGTIIGLAAWVVKAERKLSGPGIFPLDKDQ